jgi:putative GTP pyrophosphokinase
VAHVEPNYSRAEVNRAGKILSCDNPGLGDFNWAIQVLNNWRACHGYPINTFQALLRKKLKEYDGKAIVAQRLKRTPSIIAKLQRFDTMNLSQMQDMGGLRAVTRTLSVVRKLDYDYRNAFFKHELVSSKNYIDQPKSDGYRSIHLVYKYQNDQTLIYNGLQLELQLRTKLQHAWATAVETMSTFLGQSLKSGQGDQDWREFFKVASAAFAISEGTTAVPGFENIDKKNIFKRLEKIESQLHVFNKLRGFSIATNHITTSQGGGSSYHLVVLNSKTKMVNIRPYSRKQLDKANEDYSKIEERAQRGELIEAVLVSAGPVAALKKAYPNYFLDTHEFVSSIEKVINSLH